MSELVLCKARGCARMIPNNFLMCKAHWRLVPKLIKQEVWKHYKKGQENNLKLISPEYLDAASRAVLAVAQTEGLAGKEATA